jgi:hypothetical protein
MVDFVVVVDFLWVGVQFHLIKERPIRFLRRLLFAAALCLVTLLTSFNGYLRPLKIETETDRETFLRFQVLHEWAMPLILVSMVMVWLWNALRERRVVGQARP